MKKPRRKRAPKAPDGAVDEDPYLDWALGVGRPNFFLPDRQQKWMPVLVKLAGATPAEFAKGSFLGSSGEDPTLALWAASVSVPDIYTEGLGADDPDSYCMAMVTEDFLQLLGHDKVRATIESVELGLPLDEESLPDAESK
jgi:hypothetical protein